MMTRGKDTKKTARVVLSYCQRHSILHFWFIPNLLFSIYYLKKLVSHIMKHLKTVNEFISYSSNLPFNRMCKMRHNKTNLIFFYIDNNVWYLSNVARTIITNFMLKTTFKYSTIFYYFSNKWRTIMIDQILHKFPKMYFKLCTT